MERFEEATHPGATTQATTRATAGATTQGTTRATAGAASRADARGSRKILA